jgi:hypothetical protein
MFFLPMKTHLIPAGLAIALALLVTGCETDGIASRTQEKAAVYATLKPWEKKYIDKGVVAVGFTPDMVYMAVGRPSEVKAQPDSDGKAELWTYRHFYPTTDASHLTYALSGESHYQQKTTQLSPTGADMPVGAAQGGVTPSISTTGGPQGGSMDIADLPFYTLYVLFQDGKVAKIGMDRG